MPSGSFVTPINFDEHDWQNIPKIIPKYVKNIITALNKGFMRWLQDLDKRCTDHSVEISVVQKRYIDLKDQFEAEQTAERNRVNKELNAVKDLCRGLDKRLIQEVEYRQKSVKELNESLTQKYTELSKSINLMRQKHQDDTEKLHSRINSLEQVTTQRFDAASSRMSVAEAQTEKNHKDAMHHIQSANDKMDMQKKQLMRVIKETDEKVREDIDVLEEQLNEKMSDEHLFQEQQHNQLVADLRKTNIELNRTDQDLTESKERFTKRFATNETRADQLKQQLLTLILQTNEEFKKKTDTEVNRIFKEIHENDANFSDRLVALENQRKEDENSVNVKIEECHAVFGEELDALRGDLNKWLSTNAKNPANTAARLFTLETRLREEENSRMNEQSVINTALSTVVECVDQNIKLLDEKADSRAVEQLEHRVAQSISVDPLMAPLTTQTITPRPPLTKKVRGGQANSNHAATPRTQFQSQQSSHPGPWVMDPNCEDMDGPRTSSASPPFETEEGGNAFFVTQQDGEQEGDPHGEGGASSTVGHRPPTSSSTSLPNTPRQRSATAGSGVGYTSGSVTDRAVSTSTAATNLPVLDQRRPKTSGADNARRELTYLSGSVASGRSGAVSMTPRSRSSTGGTPRGLAPKAFYKPEQVISIRPTHAEKMALRARTGR